MNYSALDLYISHLVQKISNPVIFYYLYAVSYLGNVLPMFVILSLSLLYFYFTRHRKAAVYLFVTTAFGVATSTLLKVIVARPRPTSDLVTVFVHHTDFSFPSTHCVVFTIVFGFLYYYLTIHHKNYYQNKLIRTILLFLIFSVGASRIYLGAHWFTDVLGGYLLGVIILVSSIKLFKK